MEVEIKPYTRERIDDVIAFENQLRAEEDVWGWEINDEYLRQVAASFDDAAFNDSISLLAYDGDRVTGRIDCAMIKSRFDGSTKAYLDWICVVKSSRHQGIAQKLLKALLNELKVRGIDTLIALTASNEEAQRFYQAIPNSQMHDTGIWIDVI